MTHASAQPGDAEIFEAVAPAALSQVSVAANAQPEDAFQQLNILALNGRLGRRGARPGSATGGEQTVAYAATRAGSIGFAVGYAGEEDFLRNPGLGQTLTSRSW